MTIISRRTDSGREQRSLPMIRSVRRLWLGVASTTRHSAIEKPATEVARLPWTRSYNTPYLSNVFDGRGKKKIKYSQHMSPLLVKAEGCFIYFLDRGVFSLSPCLPGGLGTRGRLESH